MNVASEVAHGGGAPSCGLKVDIPAGFRAQGEALGRGKLLIDLRVLGLEGAVDEAAKTSA